MTRPQVSPWVAVFAVAERLRLEGVTVTLDGTNIEQIRHAAADLLAALGVDPAPAEEPE